MERNTVWKFYETVNGVRRKTTPSNICNNREGNLLRLDSPSYYVKKIKSAGLILHSIIIKLVYGTYQVSKYLEESGYKSLIFDHTSSQIKPTMRPNVCHKQKQISTGEGHPRNYCPVNQHSSGKNAVLPLCGTFWRGPKRHVSTTTSA